MAKSKALKITEINEGLEKLESMFQEKISELHKVKGGQTERQVFCYYRSIVWDLKDKTNKLLNLN